MRTFQISFLTKNNPCEEHKLKGYLVQQQKMVLINVRLYLV